jgi:hypothetical protein
VLFAAVCALLYKFSTLYHHHLSAVRCACPARYRVWLRPSTAYNGDNHYTTTTTYYEIQLHETLRTLKHTLSETPRSRPAVSCTSVLAARSPRAPRATQRASKLWPPSSGARDGPFPWIPSRELSSTHFLRQPRPVVSGGVGKCTKTFVYPPLLQRVRQRCSTLPFPTSPPRAPAHTHALAGRPTRSRHPTGRHLLSPHRVRPDFFIFNSSFHGQREPNNTTPHSHPQRRRERKSTESTNISRNRSHRRTRQSDCLLLRNDASVISRVA